ncbi:glycosyltransferase [Candidatus Saccharibacteria bacterium]|nr:glycosyltransferase [Candidatus Saccharibacteria bacterium]
MKQLISVIVPVYNVGGYVEKCIRSVLGQEYEELEVILVDDGSTDGSGKICDELAEEDDRVRVFHKQNGGLSDARNYGLKKAKGEVVAFVDSDDYVEKDYISEMYKTMEQTNADVIVCGYNNIKPKGEVLSGETAAVKLLTKQENIDIVAWNKLYRKNLFTENKISFPFGKKHEDMLTTYRILAKAKKVTYVSSSLYSYVERKNSIMGEGKIEERLVTREVAAKEAMGYFRNNVNLREAAEISLLLAKYAFLDFAIAGKIDTKYGEMARRWIKKHKKEFRNNKYLTNKLRFYNLISTNLGGGMYWVFRKIVHG